MKLLLERTLHFDRQLAESQFPENYYSRPCPVKITHKNVEDLCNGTTFLRNTNTQLNYTKVGFLNVKVPSYKCNLSGTELLLSPYKTENISDFQ